MAAGYPITIGLLLAGYGLPMLIGRLPLVPGGVGVVEAMMIAVFTALSVPHGIAVVATLGFRLISFWGPTLIGFPIALYLQHMTSTVEAPT
ncbi:MAG: YbhN family protein [Chloroflexota bacterium]